MCRKNVPTGLHVPQFSERRNTSNKKPNEGDEGRLIKDANWGNWIP